MKAMNIQKGIDTFFESENVSNVLEVLADKWFLIASMVLSVPLVQAYHDISAKLADLEPPKHETHEVMTLAESPKLPSHYHFPDHVYQS